MGSRKHARVVRLKGRGARAPRRARDLAEYGRTVVAAEARAIAAVALGDAFARAVEWQTKAIGLLDPKAKEREAMQARLKLYEAGKPYHEE